ncbi:MAG: hypothetical protein ACTSRJ_05095, partial [Candidatus Hodarchaeales archaeon]
FSWFAVSYLENAEVALQISTFHADNFFDYLLPTLKGTAGEDDGFFQLIRKGTSLEDLKWENLQYLCSKLRVPLSSNQLQLLTYIYEFIDNKPWITLRPRRLRSMLLEQDNTPKLSRELPKLFSMLNASWTVWPYLPALNLQTFFFQCELDLGVKLKDIIDFKDEDNQILQTSMMSSIRNSPNEYVGVIILPDRQQEVLQKYLEQKVAENLIKSFKLEIILKNMWSYSLAQYQTELGWVELPNSQWDQNIRIIKLKRSPRRRKSIDLIYLTPEVVSNWNYLQFSDPYAVIELICKKNYFDFNDLLTETYPSSDFSLLKKLFEKEILFLDFNATRLRDEYSLDVYWIEAPKITLYQLKRFLELVPDARTVFTKSTCYIRTHLSKYMVQRITRDLHWTIYPILPAHNVIQRNIRMFDKKTVSWRIPKIISS